MHQRAHSKLPATLQVDWVAKHMAIRHDVSATGHTAPDHAGYDRWTVPVFKALIAPRDYALKVALEFSIIQTHSGSIHRLPGRGCLVKG